ncbi:hypothetical protein THAOC_25059 [Thalassiosira oceanica]|uniref:Uncharacterized protein n=1 Tax=Thalassiosira oceanica TaxID=159749 RepID=K0RNB0_THAOC|nr:hypothetical protein THAOC_25059 [Thalassiosira oceanica]|eukprot:EJK55228.1 hypothetical protein THAOC_25059 [Thalassiosira oceanica]
MAGRVRCGPEEAVDPSTTTHLGAVTALSGPRLRLARRRPSEAGKSARSMSPSPLGCPEGPPASGEPPASSTPVGQVGEVRSFSNIPPTDDGPNGTDAEAPKPRNAVAPSSWRGTSRSWLAEKVRFEEESGRRLRGTAPPFQSRLEQGGWARTSAEARRPPNFARLIPVKNSVTEDVRTHEATAPCIHPDRVAVLELWPFCRPPSRPPRHDSAALLLSSPHRGIYGATAVASPYPSTGARSEAHTLTLASPPIQLASIPFDLQQARGAGYLCGCRILSYRDERRPRYFRTGRIIRASSSFSLSIIVACERLDVMLSSSIGHRI